jgi:hypothetical protein
MTSAIKMNKYNANFTLGGIFFKEFSNLRRCLLNEKFEEIVKKDIQENRVPTIKTLQNDERIISPNFRKFF